MEEPLEVEYLATVLHNYTFDSVMEYYGYKIFEITIYRGCWSNFTCITSQNQEIVLVVEDKTYSISTDYGLRYKFFRLSTLDDINYIMAYKSVGGKLVVKLCKLKNKQT